MENNEVMKNINKIKNYAVGSYVIVRTYSAGVHYGKVVAIKDNKIIITNARRMRYFVCLDDGDSLSHIALHGISPKSKITAEIKTILLEWIEVIPVTAEAKLTFDKQPYEKVK